MLVMVKSEDEELMIGFNNMGVISIFEMNSILEVMEAKCKLQLLDYNLYQQLSWTSDCNYTPSIPLALLNFELANCRSWD